MLSGKMKCRIDLHDVAGDSATEETMEAARFEARLFLEGVKTIAINGVNIRDCNSLRLAFDTSLADEGGAEKFVGVTIYDARGALCEFYIDAKIPSLVIVRKSNAPTLAMIDFINRG